MLTLLPQTDTGVVAVQADGELTHDDYVSLRRQVEQALRDHDRVRMVFELGPGFRGWGLRSAWDDFVFGVEYFNKFERCAVIGDRGWERALTMLARPFYDVRYFDRSQRDEAWEWVRSPMPAVSRGITSGSVASRARRAIARHPVVAALVAVGLGVLAVEAMRD